MNTHNNQQYQMPDASNINNNEGSPEGSDMKKAKNCLGNSWNCSCYCYCRISSCFAE